MATIKDDLGTNLISVWEMESGALGTDSHGSNNLTDNNTVGSGTGIQGGCGDFESSNSEYLSITDASQTGLDVSGNLTITAWIKRESDTGSNGIVSKFSGSGVNNRAYGLCIDTLGSASLDAIIGSGPGTYVWRGITYTFNTGTWYHVAFVYTASAGTGDFYVNGSKSGSTQTGYPTSIQNISVPFEIGHITDEGASYFDGLIDQVCIWSRALSSTDISTLYNSGSGIAYAAPATTTVVPPQIITWGIMCVLVNLPYILHA